MKILSSPVTKTTSDSLSREDCLAALRLSPNLDDLPSGSHSSANRRDALDKQISIATNNLQLGCRIRQNDKTCEKYTRCLNYLNYWQKPLDNGLTAEEIDRELCLYQWLSETLGRKDSPEFTPTSSVWPQGVRMPSIPQIREYRKSLSVRLGSLKWSLDVVMVVKSRSNSRSRSGSDDKMGGKSSSRASKVFGTKGSGCRSRTLSCTNLLDLGEDSYND